MGRAVGYHLGSIAAAVVLLTAVLVFEPRPAAASIGDLKVASVDVEPRLLTKGNIVTVSTDVLNTGSVDMWDVQGHLAIAGQYPREGSWEIVEDRTYAPFVRPGETVHLSMRVRLLSVGTPRIGLVVATRETTNAPDGQIARVVDPLGAVGQLGYLTLGFSFAVAGVWISLAHRSRLTPYRRWRRSAAAILAVAGIFTWLIPDIVDGGRAMFGSVCVALAWVLWFCPQWRLRELVQPVAGYASVGLAYALMEITAVSRVPLQRVALTDFVSTLLFWPLGVSQISGLI